ncbi:MAG: sigma-70 family RNA polymerase sigma factor [Bacteroidia bacterium]|nr:sigma-70 family RNA polymerase sigma factor [Bacteroidia bacterium]
MTDIEIVTAIRKGGREKNEAVKYLVKSNYSYLRKAFRDFQRLDEQEVESAYLGAIADFVNRVEAQKFQQKAKISTYLYVSFRRGCLDAIKKLKPNVSEESVDLKSILKVDGNPEEDYISEETQQLNEHRRLRLKAVFWEKLKQLGENCRKVFSAKMEGYSMAEIADICKLADAKSAAQTLLNCKKQLLKLMAQSPI